MRGVKRIGIYIGVSIILSLVVAGTLTFINKDNKDRLEKLTMELDSQKRVNDKFEKWFTKRETELEKMNNTREELDANIEAMEETHPNGIPSNLNGEYKKSIEEFNGLSEKYNEMLREYNQKYIIYKTGIKNFNQKTSEYNALAEEAENALIFLPGFGKKH